MSEAPITINNEVRESISSVEIKQTTKGVTFTVKVYNSDPNVAKETAVKQFDDLAKLYKQEE